MHRSSVHPQLDHLSPTPTPPPGRQRAPNALIKVSSTETQFPEVYTYSRQVAEEESIPEQIVRRRSRICSHSSFVQFLISAETFETFRLQYHLHDILYHLGPRDYFSALLAQFLKHLTSFYCP